MKYSQQRYEKLAKLSKLKNGWCMVQAKIYEYNWFTEFLKAVFKIV